jgi:predicted nucleotidyltransferase
MTATPYELPSDLPEHLPEDTRGELITVMDILLDSPLPIGIVWLYGSYARGDYIRKHNTDEKGITSVYASDIDLLVVLSVSQINHLERHAERLNIAIAPMILIFWKSRR